MTNNKKPRPPVSTEKLGKKLHISTSYIYRHQDEMPGRFRVGRCLRWDPDVVLEWMRNQGRKK
ncbi:MAG: hypothetical protein OEU68_07320 [Nitrospira sp.]|nr:hypothetical protein [Nitrospira sp.]MDH4245035.1 hypothetical protein [Nitrospira sp.]MDH4355960.1 hypothetical protein [Nitrospira sp.]MDH5319366.1 hypothetical protein [Nitrospira sp.]